MWWIILFSLCSDPVDIEELLRASPCPGPGLAGASASDLLLHPTKDTSRQCQPCAFRCFEFQAPGVGQSTRDILMVRRSMCGILIFVSGSRESRMQMSQEEDLVVSFFVYEILTDEENHEFWFRHLELCSLNHFTSSAALLARIVESSFAKLKPRVQGQVGWTCFSVWQLHWVLSHFDSIPRLFLNSRRSSGS